MALDGLSFAKCITFFCNLLFGLTGLLIWIVGAIVHFSYAHYYNFLGDSIWTVPIVLMIVGAILSIICFLGCCGAIKESSCMILSFLVLAVIILLAEVGLGIGGFVKSHSLNNTMVEQFNYTLINYNNRTDFRDSWELAQSEFHCCGINSYRDWETVLPNSTLPESCCSILIEKHCTTPYVYNEGCIHKLWQFLKARTVLLAVLSLGIAIIQILTIVFAACLFGDFRRNYETV